MNELLDIDDDRVVGLHYRLMNGFGELIDGSQGDLPLVYMHNTNALLPSLERELTGHRAGDALEVTIYPEDGYGYADESLIQEWPIEAVRERLPDGMPLIVGQRLKALGPGAQSVDAQTDRQGSTQGGDQAQLVTVIDIGDDIVRLDANHPLAGQVLHFEISVVAVREPTETEREQGYASSVNA